MEALVRLGRVGGGEEELEGAVAEQGVRPARVRQAGQDGEVQLELGPAPGGRPLDQQRQDARRLDGGHEAHGAELRAAAEGVGQRGEACARVRVLAAQLHRQHCEGCRVHDRPKEWGSSDGVANLR